MIKAEDQTLLATDLRIGNWINVYGMDDQAIDIMCDGVNTKSYPCMTYENIKGIELNEEWLIKLGFTRSSSLTELWSQGNTMLIWRTDYESDMLDNYYEFRFGITDSYKAFRQVRLDYVHQLQNLTYALTNTELTIKP